jgi:hypothetical protein
VVASVTGERFFRNERFVRPVRRGRGDAPRQSPQESTVLRQARIVDGRAAVMPPTKSDPLSGARIATEVRPARTSPLVVRGRPSLVDLAEDMHTGLLTLTPAFLNALKQVAPKKPRSKVAYVIALGLLAVFAALAADTSTREFGLGKGRALAARLHRKAPAAAPSAPAVPPAAVAVAVAASAPPAAVAVAAPPAPPAPVVAPVVKLAVTRRSGAPAGAGKSPPRPAARQALSRL